MTDAPCPQQNELQQYMSGQLAEQVAEQVSSHIDTCAICNETVSTLNPGADPLVAELKDDAPPSFSSEPECNAAINALAELPSVRPAKKPTDQKSPFALPRTIREYRLTEQIGRGGMGAVFKAEHVRLKRLVAVKVLLGDRLHDDSAVARFDREMEAVGKLDHPNIVRATDAGEDDDTHYLVMELVDGPNLSQLSKSLGQIGVHDACEVVRQAAAGLQHAHEHGLVHRDIKPSNLILADAGSRKASASAPDNSGNATVKILDLGLALLRENPTTEGELTSSGQVMGTLDYMAPEQASDTHSVDIRADIYSLGCTLYHLLAGSAPFSGSQYSTILKKMMAHAQTPVPRLSDVRSDIPAGLFEIVDRLLAKDPVERFSTPGEVLAALQAFVADANLPALLNRYRSAHKSVEHLDTQLQSTITPASSALSDTIDPVAQPKSDSNPPPKVQTDSQLASEPFAPTMIVDAPPQSFANRNNGRGNRRRTWQLFSAIGGVLLAGIVFFVGTGEGRVEITVNHPDVQISVDGQEQQINVKDGAKGEYRIELPNIPAGRRELIVARDGFTTETRHFWITRNGDRAFEMKLKPESGASVADHVTSKTADSGGKAKKTDIASSLGPAEDILPGLIPRPATIPGIKRWNLITRTHRTPVRTVAYSPDNQLIAYGTHDGQIRIRDRVSSKVQRVLISEASGCKCLEWSPDSKMLVAGHKGKRIAIWTRDGKLSATIPAENEVMSVTFSSDGQRFAFASGRSIGIATLDGTVTKLLQHGSVSHRSARWNPENKLIAASDFQGDLRIWDADGILLKQLKSAHSRGCHDMSWSRDGKHLATGLDDGNVEVWNVDTWTSLIWTGDGTPIASVSWHPSDERLLTVSSRGKVTELDRSGSLSRLIRDSNRNTSDYGGYSADGLEIFFESHPATARVRSDGTPVSSIDGADVRVSSLVWDDKNGILVSGSMDGRVRRWNQDLYVKDVLGQADYEINDIDIDPIGDRVAVAAPSGTSGIYSLGKWARIERVESDSLSHTVSWNYSNSICAFGTERHGVWLTERGRGTTLPFPEAIDSLAWHPSKDILAVGGHKGSLRVGPTNSQSPIVDTESDRLWRLDWHPHEDILAGATLNPFGIRLWDLDGKEIRRRSEATYPDQLIWSHDGSALLAAYRVGTVARISQELVTLAATPMHSTMITSLAVHPTKPIAFSGDEAGTLVRWNTETLEPDRVAVIMPEGESLQFSAAGEFLRGDRQLFEREFVYVIEDETGRRHLLTPSEFEHRRSLPGDFSVSDEHADRRFAQWVLDRGGRLIGPSRGFAELKSANAAATTKGDLRVQFSGLTDFTDADLETMARLRPARRLELFLDGTSITSAGVRHLKGVNFYGLKLTGTRVSDAISDAISELSTLKMLDLSETDVTSACFAELSKLPGLKKLLINGIRVDPTDCRQLQCQSLTELIMLSVEMSREKLVIFDGLPNLQLLHLGVGTGLIESHLNDECLKKIGSVKNLRHLTLIGTQITDAGLVHLREANGLEVVELQGCQITDVGLRQLVADHRSLTGVGIDGSQVTDHGITALSRLDQLVTLGIGSCDQLGPVGFATVAKLKNLERLTLSETAFSDPDVSQFSGHTSLKYLTIKHTSVSDAAIEHLSKMKTLQVLEVKGTKITTDGITRLRAALPNCDVRIQ